MSSTSPSASGGQSSAAHDVIEVRVRDVRQLFDAMDPSPFREKDLDPNAEEYIVESLKELPSRRACTLVIHLDQSTGIADEANLIAEALRDHFRGERWCISVTCGG